MAWSGLVRLPTGWLGVTHCGGIETIFKRAEVQEDKSTDPEVVCHPTCGRTGGTIFLEKVC